MAIGGIARTGNSRNNFLYGTQGRDSLDGGAGNDYLRGYEGNDLLTGGVGADRFVFERTWAANGTDRITDFEAGLDILDLSLVGFSRGVLSQDQRNIIRIEQTDTGARLLIDLDGHGNSFQAWARLDGLSGSHPITLQLGARTLTAVVEAPEAVLSASGPAQLGITAGIAAVAQLYVAGSGTPGAAIGGSVHLGANVQGHLGVAAQGSVTVAELRLSGPGTSGAPANTLVYLGTGGDDTVYGTEAADIIFGFDGADTLIGGAGADDLTGGSGADTFAIAFGGEGNDTIRDFSVAQGDVIDFTGVSDATSGAFALLSTFSDNSNQSPWYLGGMTVFNTMNAQAAGLGAADIAAFLADINAQWPVEYVAFNSPGQVAYIAVSNGVDTGIYRLAEAHALADGGAIDATEITQVAALVGMPNAFVLSSAHFPDFF